MSRFYTLDDNETPNGLTDEALRSVKTVALAMDNAQGLAFYEAIFAFVKRAEKDGGVPPHVLVAGQDLLNAMTVVLTAKEDA